MLIVKIIKQKIMDALGNATFENYVGIEQGFSEMSYQMVAHVLTLGYAVMLAGLFYFILTMRTVAPRYRISSVLSVVVTVSAFLLLFKQANNWSDAFEFNAEKGRYFLAAGADLFNNGYRYLNWLIDVPMLLFQILFVVALTQSSFSSIRNQFWFSGAAMIITGYVGQYYEVTNITNYFIWGGISTLFFIHILILMNRVIKEGKEGAPEKARKAFTTIWRLFLFSWMLYPGAYLMPHLAGIEGGFFGETGVVARQITYTIADISSKVIYGVLLTVAARAISQKEGYDFKKVHA